MSLYKIAAGVVLGYVIGNLMGRFLFRLPTTESVAAEIMGAVRR